MSDINEKILSAICEMRDLIRLMAEPQIAARDEKLRAELFRIAGKSPQKIKSVFLMDGSHMQTAIHKKTGMAKSNLSTFVTQLSESKLLTGDVKQPKLVISIPVDFFDKHKG